MLLFFRFIFAMIRGHLRPPIDGLETAVSRFTVMPTDCDLNVHLNAGRFLSFMDVARMELLARTRLMAKLVRRGWRPIMGGVVVRYRRSILPFQRFDVRSRVAGWDEKWFYIEHVMERNGTFCAHAYVRMVIRKKDGNVRPADVIALAGREGLASPELPEFVVRWRDMEDQR
jgi:acyl-CoA thioesterase FadM